MTDPEQLENEAIGFIVNNLSDKNCVLYFSGGKGSCIVRHLLQRADIPYAGLFKRPGFHADGLEDFIKQFDDITIIDNDVPLIEQVKERGFLPSVTDRYCCYENWEHHNPTGDYVAVGGMTFKPWRMDMKRVFCVNGKIADVNPILHWTEEEVDAYVERYDLKSVPRKYLQGHFNCIVCPLQKEVTRETYDRFLRMWEDHPDQLRKQREASDLSFDMLKAKNYPVLANDKDEYFRKWCCKEQLVGGVGCITELR